MTDHRFPFVSCLALVFAALALASPAEARGPSVTEPVSQSQMLRQTGEAVVSPGAMRRGDRSFRVAGGDCSGAAAQAAAQSGGQVLSVSASQQGGRAVCVVTVLVPGQDGGRPRKKTITIPQ